MTRIYEKIATSWRFELKSIAKCKIKVYNYLKQV